MLKQDGYSFMTECRGSYGGRADNTKDGNVDMVSRML